MANPNITVSGFAGHLLALNGTYTQNGQNHGKVQYKKIGGGGAGQESCIYYWDARDGENLSGWWVAPVVGGEQVWAHCLNHGDNPPQKGWKVPWHKPEPDPLVSMMPVIEQKRDFDGAFGGGMGGPNKMARTMEGMQPLSGIKGGGKKGYGKGGGYGGPGVGYGGPGGGTQRNQGLIQNIENSISNAEKSVGKLSEDGMDTLKNIEMSKKMYQSAQKMFDAQAMRLELEHSEMFQGRLAALASEVNAKVEAANAKVKGSIDEAASTLGPQTDDDIANAHKHLQELKDEYDIKKEEMEAEIDPTMDLDTRFARAEDILAMADVIMAKSTPLNDILSGMKNRFTEVEALMRTAAGVEGVEELKPLLVTNRQKLTELEKEVGIKRRMVSASSQKAKAVHTQVKRQKEAEMKKQEEEKKMLWGAQQIVAANEMGMYVDSIFEEITEDTYTKETIMGPMSQAVGLLEQLSSVQREPYYTAGPADVKAGITKIVTKVKKKIDLVNSWEAKKIQAVLDGELSSHIQLGGAVDAYIKKNEMTPETFFTQMGGGAEKIDMEKAASFLKETVGAPVDIVDETLPRLWTTAAFFVSKVAEMGQEDQPVTELDCDEFFLYVANCYYSCKRPIAMTSEKDNPTDASKKVAVLETFDVVRVLEGPVMVSVQPDANNMAARRPPQPLKGASDMPRVRCVRVSCGTEGWVSLKTPGNAFLERFNPQHFVVQETVLTDIFDLQDFNVIRRVKKDEKVICLGVPKFKAQDAAVGGNLLRIRICALGSEEAPTRDVGWVTVKGNNGAMFVKNDSMAKPFPRMVVHEQTGTFVPLLKNPDLPDKLAVQAEAYDEDTFKARFAEYCAKIPNMMDAKVAIAEEKLAAGEAALKGFCDVVNPSESIVKPLDDNWTTWEVAMKRGDDENCLTYMEKLTKPEVVQAEVAKYDDTMKAIQLIIQPMRQTLNALSNEFNSKPPRGSGIPDSVPTTDGADPAATQAAEQERKEMTEKMSDIFRIAPVFQEKHKKFSELSTKILFCTARRDRLKMKLSTTYAQAEKDAQADKVVAVAEKLVTELAERETEIKGTTEKLDKFKAQLSLDVQTTAVTMMEKADEVDVFATALKEKCNEDLKWINEQKPTLYVSVDPLNPNGKKAPLKLDTPDNPVAKAMNSFMTYHMSVQKLSTLTNHVASITKDVKMKSFQQGQEEIAFALREKGTDLDALFAAIQKKQAATEPREDDRVTAAVLAAYFNDVSKIPTNEAIVAKTLDKAAPMAGDQTCGPEDWPFFSRILYRCTKDTLITGDLELGTKINKVGKLFSGELFELLERGKTSEGGLFRVHGKTVESQLSGWATMRGNKGMVFLAPYVRGLACKIPGDSVTETEEATSTVVYNLQRGDKVELMSYPKKCGGTDTAPIYRAQVKLIFLGPNGTNTTDVDKTGFLTLTGNVEPFVQLAYSTAYLKKLEADKLQPDVEMGGEEPTATEGEHQQMEVEEPEAAGEKKEEM